MRVLSLDAGGVRGLISLAWLKELEKRVDVPLCEYFDIVVGSSTGAIIASFIGLGLSVDIIIEKYIEQCQTVFPRGLKRFSNRFFRTFTQGLSAPMYDDRILGKVLHEMFKEQKISDLKTNVLITSFDISSNNGVVFKRKHDMQIADAVKASCSAPSYFSAHEIDGRHYIDGVIMFGNPTLCGISEAMNVCPLSDVHVLSLGTGKQNFILKNPRKMGPLEWALPIVSVLMNGNHSAVDYTANKLIGDRYVRLQMSLTEDESLFDNASSKNTTTLLKLAEKHLFQYGITSLEQFLRVSQNDHSRNN